MHEGFRQNLNMAEVHASSPVTVAGQLITKKD